MPPALRIMCASPGFNPRQRSNRILESMQARTANRRRGLTARSPRLKFLTNCWLAASSSSATDNVSPFRHEHPQVRFACRSCGRWLSSQFNRYNRPVNLDDTVVAIATPPGRGGIGVVRIAGPRALEIAKPLLRLKRDLEAGRTTFADLIEPCGIDTPVRVLAAEPAAV